MQLTAEQKAAAKACEDKVVEILKEHDCHLEAFATLTHGQAPAFNIVIAPNVEATKEK